MSDERQKDDALFEALGKSKKKRKHRIIRTVIIVVMIIAVILAAGILILRQQVKERFASNSAEVLSYEASLGSISTTVAGSGSLTDVDLEQLTVPEGVEITEVIAGKDDLVEAGDLLATVDMASVMSALADRQAQLDALDEQISDAKGDTVDTYVTAGVSGRVKIIYAVQDESVAACMAEYGALAVISLDGYLAADIASDALTAGDSVTVVLADGTETGGTVETVSKGTATILVSDNGPEYGETVTVRTGDGTELGSAALYIHNPLSVTGYAGTVQSILVSENSAVTASTKLFRLKDTSSSANYDTLLRSRGELEEELMELLTIYRDGAILSPYSGKVSSIDYSDDDPSVLLTLGPNTQMSVTISVDETDILALEVGQAADVSISSVSEETFPGTVTEINKTATTSSGVTTYSAAVTLDKMAGMLPGMTASVDVKIEGVEDVLLIPVDALHQTSAISYVYTSYDEETQQYGGMVEVTTGMQNSSYVEITSGLQEGDTVYYTEAQSFSFGGMSGNRDFGGTGGEMPFGGSGSTGGRGNMGGAMPGKG